jgi:hypothetical protein
LPLSSSAVMSSVASADATNGVSRGQSPFGERRA